MGEGVTGIAPALRDAAVSLESVSQTPRLDAELLMAHALRIGRSELLLKQAELAVPDSFGRYLARRMAHEPVAYITGRQDFWDLQLAVTPVVLIPRADSETLIEAAITAFAGRQAPLRVLDLGTGSGALLLAAMSVFPLAHGLGIDASARALAVAENNARTLGFDGRTEFRHLSWKDTGWVDALGGPFNLVLCNPPYVEDTANLAPMVADQEPHSALFAGPDGLDDYRVLIPAVPDLLAVDGLAIFEIGHSQTQAVSDLASKAGLSTEMRRDLAGNPRCLRFSLGISGRDRYSV
jgi:release factor glutamine methyltransferase